MTESQLNALHASGCGAVRAGQGKAWSPPPCFARRQEGALYEKVFVWRVRFSFCLSRGIRARDVQRVWSCLPPAFILTRVPLSSTNVLHRSQSHTLRICALTHQSAHLGTWRVVSALKGASRTRGSRHARHAGLEARGEAIHLLEPEDACLARGLDPREQRLGHGVERDGAVNERQADCVAECERGDR